MGAQNAANTVMATSWLEVPGNSDRPGTGVVVERLESGLVSIALPEAARITAAHVTTVREQLIAAFAGEPCGLLVRLNGVAFIDRDAMTDYVRAVTVTALALMGRTPVDLVVANRILGIRSPGCPSRYFTDATEALQWLRTERDTGPEKR